MTETKLTTNKGLVAALKAAAIAASLGALTLGTAVASESNDDGGKVKHVLLISVDGLHQTDLAWYVQTHTNSTLAKLVADGVDFSNASTPFPSDSFPGMVALATGGNPKTTGVYYDDTWNRTLLPAGSTSASGATPGVEVTYFEALDKNFSTAPALDAGQGIIPAAGSDPFANILQMTGNPLDVIDPAQLPVDPVTFAPVYPHQYLKVNTVFEVAHRHGLRTAWSDKHPAYEVLSGPSGHGVDEYFTPEINSSADPLNPTSPDAGDWTTDNLLTQKYDNYKVQAVVNWIKGKHHDGTGNPGTPAIFGMNFQSVSTAEKLPTSYTEGTTAKLAGGYLADGSTPGPVLSNALDFVDSSLGKMVQALKDGGLYTKSAIIISAKHGQSPMNPAALNRISDGKITGALNAAWAVTHPSNTSLVTFSVNDDGMLLWLNDRSKEATDFARNFLMQYNDASASVDGKPVVSAGLTQIYTGAAAAALIGVDVSDDRVPDVIGIAQYGTVYTGKKKKISEHGGDHTQDRNVPILVSGAGVPKGIANNRPVETTQVAPTILKFLGLEAEELKAVRLEGTQPLF
jgi:hypothetical protein